MLLAIDAGNTNVVFALVDVSGDARQIRARWRIATDPRRTGDEYASGSPAAGASKGWR